MDVRAAKWVVTQSRTSLGQRYCLYLIDLEAKVDKLQKWAKQDPLLGQILASIAIRSQQLEQASPQT